MLHPKEAYGGYNAAYMASVFHCRSSDVSRIIYSRRFLKVVFNNALNLAVLSRTFQSDFRVIERLDLVSAVFRLLAVH